MHYSAVNKLVVVVRVVENVTLGDLEGQDRRSGSEACFLASALASCSRLQQKMVTKKVDVFGRFLKQGALI